MENKRKTADNVLCFAILLIISIAYGLLSYFTPPQIDDLSFISIYRKYSGGSDDFQLRALFSIAHENWLVNNARFANVLSPVVNLISPWKYIFPWLSGVMIALIVWFSIKIIDIRENKSVLAALLWGAYVLFLPWRNGIFIPDFLLNYVYASSITLGFTYILVERSSLLRNVWVFIGMLIWAFLAGGWHEGFSVPTLAGIAMLIPVRFCRKSYRKRGWRWYAVITVYLAAAIYIIFCPGTLGRAADEVSGGETPRLTIKILIDFFPSILFTIILLATLAIGKWRKILKDALENDLFIVLATTSFAGAAISLIVTHSARTSFYPDLTAIIAMVMLLRASIFMLLKKHWVKTLAAITVILCIAHAAHSIRWQYRFYQENRELMTRFVDEGKMTVFHDIIMPESVDILTLYFPVKGSWVTDTQYYALSDYLKTYPGRSNPGDTRAKENPAVVPTALRNVTMESGEAVNSADEEFQIRRVDDALFTQRRPFLRPMDIMKVILKMKGSDETIVADGLALNFVTEQGDSLLYIKPYKIDNRQIKEARVIPYHTQL